MTATAQDSALDCEKTVGSVIWTPRTFISSFLYGNQDRFSIYWDGISVGSGDIRLEGVFDLETFNKRHFEIFSSSAESQRLEIDGMILEHLSREKPLEKVTYFRISDLGSVVGFGFFGDRLDGSINSQTVAAYILDSENIIYDMRISYSTNVADACVFRDAVKIIAVRMKNG